VTIGCTLLSHTDSHYFLGATMKTITRLFIALYFVAATVLPAYATSFSTDQSDLWWVPSESGWGMQLVQRGSVIFATLFVYDPSGHPIWYTATLQPTGTNYEWSGALYLTNGPWFGTNPFNPALVGHVQVGTMTWNAQFVESGTVVYSVNGVVVTKNVTRQLLAYDNYAGSYLGALHLTATGCFDPASNGTFAGPGIIAVTQSGQSVSVSFLATSTGNSITLSGVLTQYGQFGTIRGAYQYAGGEAGNFAVFEINGQSNYWMARFSTNSTSNGCVSTGYLGGIRQ